MNAPKLTSTFLPSIPNAPRPRRAVKLRVIYGTLAQLTNSNRESVVYFEDNQQLNEAIISISADGRITIVEPSLSAWYLSGGPL